MTPTNRNLWKERIERMEKELDYYLDSGTSETIMNLVISIETAHRLLREERG